MRDPIKHCGEWLVSPAKLKDGTWGVWLPNKEAKQGDVVCVETRKGHNWHGQLTVREHPESGKWRYRREKRERMEYDDWAGAGAEHMNDGYDWDEGVYHPL